MPAIAKILIVFAATLLLTRVRLQLGLALALGGVALNLWAGIDPAGTARNTIHALLGAELWMFVVITAMIIEIARFITKEKNASEIVAATQRWGGRHGAVSALMALPAVIGLIPMPAGALFSAPFVEQTGTRIQGAPDWKSAVNYWFRHVWEYWWPLYPGVIIAMSIFKMDVWQFILAQVLYTPVSLAAGYIFLVRPHVASLALHRESDSGNDRRALALLAPLAVVVVAIFAVPVILPVVAPGMELQFRKMTALLVGLCAALVVIAVEERKEGRPQLFSTLFRKKSLNVMYSLIGVLVFKAMLKSSGLLPEASQELIQSGIPPALAVAALPFLAGVVTGIALGFTGASFPLVVGLMATPGSGLTPLATLVLAYGFGYIGMMLSPVHLCLLVTKDYFASNLLQIYRRIFPCALTVLAYACIAHIVLRTLGW